MKSLLKVVACLFVLLSFNAKALVIDDLGPNQDFSNINFGYISIKGIDLNNSNLQYGYPRSFAILDTKNNLNDVNLGNSLDENAVANNWLNAFGIDVIEQSENYERNFSGALWVKNLCFDAIGDKTWQFSKEFVDKLVTWHGSNFNWGIKYYRGKSIILWDTLRDFESN